MPQTQQSLVLKTLKFFSLYALLMTTYLLTRNIKDVWVIVSGDALLIPFLKTYILYAKIAVFAVFVIFYRQDRLDKFYSLLGSLFILFSVALAVLNISGNAPSGLASFYYVFVSLFMEIALVLVFWVTANATFNFRDAKIAYPLILASVAVLTPAIGYIYSILASPAGDISAVSAYIQIITSILVALSMVQLKYISQSEEDTLEAPNCYSSLSTVTLLIILAVCAYTATDLLKILVKLDARATLQSPADYSEAMNFLYYNIGLLTLPVALLGAFVAIFCKWRTAALVSPVIFFTGLLLYWMNTSNSIEFVESSALYAFKNSGVATGFMIQSLMSGLMSLLFIATLMRAFIPLAASLKARGVALAKFLLAGSTITSGIAVLIIMLNDLDSSQIINHGIAISIGLTLAWILAVILIGRRIRSVENNI